ncbi:MAG TPA: hypothetical protein VGV13_00945 [Methylomirabilota bacterium]|jgi:hypothetical protein|nr:hypothetical protein [Methylomirabilota bacterium]
MAIPVAGFVRLPDDSANLGKKVRTQKRTVGADDVQEHFFIPVSKRSKLGVFHYSPALQSVQASAQDGITTGFFWLQNPAGSAVDGVFVRMVLRFNSTNAASGSVPRIALARFTFTGTASGATVTPAMRKTTEASNVLTMRTASTGMTVTVGALIASFLPPLMASTAATLPTTEHSWPEDGNPVEDADLILLPGEGAVLYQPDAGTASDARRFVAQVRVEEIEH